MKSLFPDRSVVAYSSQAETKQQLYRVYELDELSSLWKGANLILPGRCLSKTDHITCLSPMFPLVLCEIVSQYMDPFEGSPYEMKPTGYQLECFKRLLKMEYSRDLKSVSELCNR